MNDEMKEQLQPINEFDKLRLISLVDLDDLFHRSLNKVILTDCDFTKSGYSETLRNHLHSKRDILDSIATCECEHLKSNFYLGMTCPKCHTEVTIDDVGGDNFQEHKVWIRLPDEIPGALQPNAFFTLRRFLIYGENEQDDYDDDRMKVLSKNGKKQENYLESILDVTTPPHPSIAEFIPGKGFSYFYHNFDYIMDFFLNRFSKTAKKKEVPIIKQYIRKYRDRLFCRHFPALTSTLHAVINREGQKSKKAKYVDQYCQHILHCANILSFLKYKSKRHRSQKEIERLTFDAYQELMGYESLIIDKHLSDKKALPRMHLFGTRFHVSFRSVISPIIGPHQIDELHIPFNVAVNTFRPEILGRLMEGDGLNDTEAFNKHQTALVKFDEDIYQILVGLIRNCPYKGIPVLWVRNPVVRAGGVELMFVTQIKTDMGDQTISMSSLMCPFSNADFDGDEKNGFRIPTMEMVEEFKAVHASRLYLSHNEMSVTPHITIPKLTQITINKFLGRV